MLIRSTTTGNRARGLAWIAAAAILMMGAEPDPAPAPAKPKTTSCEADRKNAKARIATFDTLDFDVFTHQKWDRLQESHAADVIVHWPDGHQTRGIDKHIAELKAMFVYAPDTRIQEHPVKFGSGEWTSVIGIMEGTFTQPMPMSDGSTVPPTGRPFKLEMCTVGHWKNGVMDEEYLFWDNLTFMKQLGLPQEAGRAHEGAGTR